ncbi:MAG: hypothetical protein AAB874_03865 [Patescibacteria group bacterium]
MQTKTSVSYKSPKTDIWTAYQELLSSSPVLPSATLPKKLETTTAQLKSQLTSQLSDLNSTLDGKLAELGREFDQATEVLAELHALHLKQSQTLAQEKEAAQKARQREEEEYRYEFDKQKKRQSEELAEQKQKVEMELSAKRIELKLQEDELKDLRQKVATFETELNKAVKEAVTKTSQELTLEFNHQKAFANQTAKSSVELLEQKVNSLEATINNYQAEIAHLQSSLKEANQQLTRIAERAVEKSPSPLPQTPKE